MELIGEIIYAANSKVARYDTNGKFISYAKTGNFLGKVESVSGKYLILNVLNGHDYILVLNKLSDFVYGDGESVGDGTGSGIGFGGFNLFGKWGNLIALLILLYFLKK